MNTFHVRALVLLVVLYGMPTPTRAISSEVFDLPDGHAGESYQTDIEVVLRDRYRLKIETGVRESILQWALVEGELPLGLAVTPDGKIAGTANTHNDQPYFFRVKVTDMAVTGADALIIPFSLLIRPARLRLTTINGPTLAPIPDFKAAVPNGARAPGSGETLAAGPRRIESKPPAVSALRSGPSVPPKPGATPPKSISINDYSRSDNPMLSMQRTRNRGMVSKVIGFLGFGQDTGGAAAGGDGGADCDSAANHVTSDEAHTPLEGDTSTQKTCVRFINLNPIRFRYEFNEKRTTSAGPDISSLPFLPKIPPTAPSAVSPASSEPASPQSWAVAAFMITTHGADKEKAAKDLDDQIQLLNTRFNKAKTDLNDIETRIRDSVENPVNLMITDVQNAHKHSVRLATSADIYLQSSSIPNLLAEVGTVKDEIDAALNNNWPVEAIALVQNDLDILLSSLDIRFDKNGKQDVSQEAWTQWLAANQDRYNRVRDRIPELRNKVNTINAGAGAFNDSKNILADWQLIINNVASLGGAAFEQEALVSCHTDEGENQSSKLSMSKTDRTVPNQPVSTREVLTVNCYSRVAITGGFNFSTLDEKEFSVVQSAGPTPGTVVKKFGFLNNSSFRPNPLALINLRFTDRPVYNWHASFGAVVDLKGQTGTDVEPVAGVSFSIRRLMFITPFAVHFGRVTKLAGDFKIGDTVPDAVATPPLEKAWKIGYTAGVTFRIAPQ